MVIRKMNKKYNHKEIIAYHLEGKSSTEIANILEADKGNINDIIKDKKWESK